MVHNERNRYLHWSAIVIQLQYTIGLKSSSIRLKGGELIVSRFCALLLYSENLKTEQFFFCWFQAPGKLFDLTLSMQGENRPISYKMRQVFAIIPPVWSCLFTMATVLFIQKNVQNKM